MNSTKNLIYIVLLLFLSSCYSKKPNLKTGLEGKEMPAIDFISIDTTSHFNTNDLKAGKPAIIFAFEPWCPYCKAQTKSILSHIESLKDIDFYFVTNAAYPGFREFYNKYQLANYSNIRAGIDYTYGFARYIRSSKVPVTAIYGRDRKLKQVLFGKHYISTIKDIAFN